MLNINERIIKEILPQIKKINKTKLEYKARNEKFGNKMLGNAVANILRKYIENFINYYNLDYSVSLGNSYISTIPTEWDLIICKKGLLPDSNIVEPENVVAVVEFKSSGNVDTKYKEHTKQEYLSNEYDKRFGYLNNIENKIIFAYISFSMDLEWYRATKEYFDSMNGFKDTVFTFLNDYELDKGKIIGVEGCENFEKYLFNILVKEENNES